MRALREKTSMSQGVEFNRLMLDMRAMQMDAMSAPKPVSGAQEAGASSFADMLGQAVNKVAQTQQASSQLANAFEVGKSGIDLTDVMISSQKASVSFQALTQVRNKLVQAYQDIMQMPV
ncbi:Flagellar hook-basal body complex protein FliE [Pseudomonas syringae pv. tomato]|nr:flagellar hook-basal body complex protein FliE [Pseudomonas syringae pv. tomato str. DC3000]KPY94949.1 Flagellar hook-basal body complex protein FliE [Pseudomonas syringae pv. tomato]RMN51010.1 Flagellar hook-basal body complex protein FliE [Pseudomonas syringae pv. apii]RMO81715.1 Flagellar hook-basal body complex protein FliE [Pseudomonas syringae pv. primulae]RMV36351.1 Flagellar hook-basal body complex protein FliE [Pseudomonas syringae pv. maculicola]